MKKICLIIVSTISFIMSLGANAAPKPLSCEVLTLLVGVTALGRDAGIKMDESTIAKNSENELTKAEVKFILNKVYIEGKGRSPDEIKDAVYERCKNGRR